LEREGAVVVRVEELDEVEELTLGSCVIMVVSQEAKQLMRLDTAARVAINSLESGVRREVPDLAETLAEIFEVSLSIADSNEQVLKPVFRIVAKHLH